MGPIHIEYTVSRNACLCKKNLCALMGKAVSQVDAPFSNANSTAFWSVGGSEFFKFVDVSCCFSRRCFLVSPFSSSCAMYLVVARCFALYIESLEVQ